jgi:hypothetical protein
LTAGKVPVTLLVLSSQERNMMFKNATKKSHDPALAVNELRDLLDQMIEKARGENFLACSPRYLKRRPVPFPPSTLRRRQFCEAALRASLACDSVTEAEPIHVVPAPAWLPRPALSMRLLGLSAHARLDRR